MGSSSQACETFFDIVLGIGTLVAALFACGNVGTETNWLAYFDNVDSDSYKTVQQTKYWQDIAQVLAIAGYAFSILVLIVVTAITAFCKKTPTGCIIALLVLLIASSVCALLANAAALVLAVFATYRFNAATLSYMNSSLYSGKLYDLTNGTLNPNDSGNSGVYWHAMQFQLQCCGINNSTDYVTADRSIWHARNTDALAPLSCCTWSDSIDESYPSSTNEINQSCFLYGNQSTLYNEQGCFSKLQQHVITNETTVVVLACCVISQVLFTHFVRLYVAFRSRDND